MVHLASSQLMNIDRTTPPQQGMLLKESFPLHSSDTGDFQHT